MTLGRAEEAEALYKQVPKGGGQVFATGGWAGVRTNGGGAGVCHRPRGVGRCVYHRWKEEKEERDMV